MPFSSPDPSINMEPPMGGGAADTYSLDPAFRANFVKAAHAPCPDNRCIAATAPPAQLQCNAQPCTTSHPHMPGPAACHHRALRPALYPHQTGKSPRPPQCFRRSGIGLVAQSNITNTTTTLPSSPVGTLPQS